MALDAKIVTRCFDELVARAKRGAVEARDGRITYSEMAQHLGVANQSVGKYLNQIYCREVQGRSGVPDFTTLVVYADTNYGRFNSRGKKVQSVRVDAKNPKDRREYEEELRCVYKYWGRK